MPESQDAKLAMVEAGRRLWYRGLVGAKEGNLSVRLEDGTILCTAAGLDKGHMDATGIVEMSLDGSFRGEVQPSSEVRIHLRAYRERPDCRAVVHAHPPAATAFTVAGVPFPNDCLPEAAYVLGPVASVPFAFPGSEEVPDSLVPYLPGHKTFLLSHHGAMTLGATLEDAVDRMETLERIARILANATLLGGVTPMPKSAMDRLVSRMNGGLS